MEANQIRKIFEAMTENGFSNLELEIGQNSKLRMKLDHACENGSADDESFAEMKSDATIEIPRTQVEIRSDKVGSFSFADRQLLPGDAIRKGEILGTIKGISFQDKVKCSLDGFIETVFVENGSVVDYGRLLFVVNID